MDAPRIDGLTYKAMIAPEDVFEVWRKNEAGDAGWEQVAKDHGYPSWEAWRRHRFSMLGGKNPVWWRYRIDDPLATVPNFYGGPSKTWIRLHYGKEALVRFRDFADPAHFTDNAKVKSLLRDFPRETEITGVVTEGNDVVIIEGTHRCTAIAVAAKEGRSIATDMHVALTRWRGDDFPVPDPHPDGPFRVPLTTEKD